MDLTLWLLNRCAHWERDAPGKLASALSVPGHHVQLGARIRTGGAADAATLAIEVNEDEDSFRGELMHEGLRQAPSVSQYDEYFVPIPVKCFGDVNDPGVQAFWNRTLDGGFARLSAIIDPQINPCWNKDDNGESFDRFWLPDRPGDLPGHVEGGPKLFGDIRMNTVERRGLYQILSEHAVLHGSEGALRRHVLVGYSQGGLVARYLAYIDEHLVLPKKRCIAGIFTVHAPLRGSPLATPTLDGHVLGALLAGVACLVRAIPAAKRHQLQVWGQLVPPASPIGQVGRREAIVDVREICRVLDAAFVDANNAQLTDLAELLRTARKWVSGLHHDTDLAFADLDLCQMEAEGRVLNAVATTDLSIPHGATVGTDWHLDGVVDAALKSWMPCLGGLIVHIFGNKIRALVDPLEDVIRNDAMDAMPLQSMASESPILQGFLANWKVDNGPLQAHDHDFVIPSASQLELDTGEPTFLGNHVFQTTHMSGGAIDSPDFDAVRDMLEQVR